jgi:hypothetical protein
MTLIPEANAWPAGHVFANALFFCPKWELQRRFGIIKGWPKSESLPHSSIPMPT